MSFQEQLATLLGVPIKRGNLRQYIGLLDREGRITKKVQLDLILLVSDRLLELDENKKEEVVSILETAPSDSTILTVKEKRQANMKKAQEQRRRNYELRRAQNQNNS